jgi:putative oxidoreductase
MQAFVPAQELQGSGLNVEHVTKVGDEHFEFRTQELVCRVEVHRRTLTIPRMKTLLRILRLEFLPASVDLGLLALRLWLGLSLLLLHGWGKLSNFQQMSAKFADPLGIGTQASLGLAVFGEVVGSVLLIFGLFSRLAALSCATTMAVAFFLVHKMVLKGPGSGELAFIYLAGFLTILIAGPGRFALDGKSGGARTTNKPRP